MRRKQIKQSIALVLITLIMLSMLGKGYAADGPEVTLVVNPRTTEVQAGAEKIVITVIASGKNLSFAWKLSGPGKLEGEGAAAFYIPPETIDKETEFAIITVTVKDSSGQATIESVPFTILPRSEKAATPSPEPTPKKKKGMSTGTKIALGAGAIVVLGVGAAALTLSGKEESPCDGAKVGDYCWYLGARGASCTDTCAPHGGYHDATRTYAGSSGTDANCHAVLSALGAPADSDGTVYASDYPYAIGCMYWIDEYYEVRWNRYLTPTTADSSNWASYRACACAK